nr:unnamed protein product [Spirometra erinaceieuropaei]
MAAGDVAVEAFQRLLHGQKFPSFRELDEAISRFSEETGYHFKPVNSHKFIAGSPEAETFVFSSRKYVCVLASTRNASTSRMRMDSGIPSRHLDERTVAIDDIPFVDACGVCGGNTMRYQNMLVNPSNLLILGQAASKEQLVEGLRNALARVARLSDYRHQQTARNMALLQQVDQLNSDMDAAVDALRHQQNKFENERMRAVMDARKLRAQLAEAVAMLEQSKVSMDGKVAQRHPLSLSASSDLTDVPSLSDEVCSLCSNRPLEILTLRITVDKLETELTRQKCATEKETARLRGQLAESIADARALRLQLARLSRSSSPPVGGGLLNEGMLPIQQLSSPCSNCLRLQKLVDLLQQKQSEQQQQPSDPISTPAGNMNRVSEPFPNPPEKNDDPDNDSSSGVPDIISGCSKDQITALPLSPLVSRLAVDAVTQTLNHEITSANVRHTPSTSSTLTQGSPPVSEKRLSLAFATPCEFDHGSSTLPGGLFSLLESGEVASSPPSSTSTLLGESLPPVLEAVDPQQSPSSSSSTNHCQLDESQVLQHPIVQFLNDQLKTQQETIARLKNSPALPDRSPATEGGEVDVVRLQERLRALEAEVESSADQLKASNIEFLELRERLTNATVERAHLKATVDGLDDQVTQLEAALYERSLELRQCRSRLSEYEATDSLTSPSLKGSFHSPFWTRDNQTSVSPGCSSVAHRRGVSAKTGEATAREVKTNFLARYADGAFIIIGQDIINYYGGQLNLITTNLQFAMEEEVEDKLPFLDVLVCHQPNGKLATDMARPYRELLLQHPNITNYQFRSSEVQHDVVHQIRTRFIRSGQATVVSVPVVREGGVGTHAAAFGRPRAPGCPICIWFQRQHQATGDPVATNMHFNNDTITDCYPAPHLQNLTGVLFGKEVLSKIDFVRAFHQILVAPEDIPEITVTTLFDSLEFIHMLFSLRNADQTFQSKNGVIIDAFLACLILNSLTIMLTRKACALPISTVKDSRDFPPPTPKRQLQRFLDVVTFYRQFLSNCADLMLPLINMLSDPKGPLELTDGTLTVFQRIKALLADATLLTNPALESRSSLTVDAPIS